MPLTHPVCGMYSSSSSIAFFRPLSVCTGFPFSISWFATWFGVTAATLGLVFLSVFSLLMVVQAFLLFLVMSVLLISSLHLSLLSSSIEVVSASPSSMVFCAKGSSL